ncbi:MAG: hypothetical protein WCJ40_01885 [Planctomycetota bacterium]
MATFPSRGLGDRFLFRKILKSQLSIHCPIQTVAVKVMIRLKVVSVSLKSFKERLGRLSDSQAGLIKIQITLLHSIRWR